MENPLNKVVTGSVYEYKNLINTQISSPIKIGLLFLYIYISTFIKDIKENNI